MNKSSRPRRRLERASARYDVEFWLITPNYQSPVSKTPLEYVLAPSETVSVRALDAIGAVSSHVCPLFCLQGALLSGVQMRRG